MDRARLARVAELFNPEKVNGFGPMHITVEDGNVDDGSLDFIEGEMKKEGATAEEWELLKLLREMDEDEREFAWWKSGQS